MQTFSNKNQIFIGRKAGTEILKAIKNAKKSIKIVSPYLSPSYLEELLKLSKKGVNITLITADELEQGDNIHSTFKHSDVIKQKKKIITKKIKRNTKPYTLISFIIFLASIITFSLSFLIASLLVFAFFLIIISLILLIYSYTIKDYTLTKPHYEYSSIFKIKVFDSHSGKDPLSTNLIHSKIFLIDEKTLFLGSVNLTYAGFNTHYETSIQVQDLRAIKDVSQEIENLYNSTELASKSIDKWGREIYE